MVWIEATAEDEVHIRAPAEAVMAFISDVPTCGKLWPGVQAIEPLGNDEYRWSLEERRTLGTVFRPEYVSRYQKHADNGISFTTVSGNVKSSSHWTITSLGDQVRLRLRVTSEVDAPVPRMLKKPAELFAKREVQSGMRSQLEGIKRRLEG